MRLLLSLAILSSCAPPAAPNAAGPAPVEKTCEPPQLMPLPPNLPPNSTYLAAGKPIPQRYRGAPAKPVSIQFMSAAQINRFCAAQPSGLPICQRIFYACVRDGKLFMPNPCDEPEAPAGQGYVGTLCHEIAHVNGWPATHGD